MLPVYSAMDHFGMRRITPTEVAVKKSVLRQQGIFPMAAFLLKHTCFLPHHATASALHGLPDR
jgi:hypothetical protein